MGGIWKRGGIEEGGGIEGEGRRASGEDCGLSSSIAINSATKSPQISREFATKK